MVYNKKILKKAFIMHSLKIQNPHSLQKKPESQQQPLNLEPLIQVLESWLLKKINKRRPLDDNKLNVKSYPNLALNDEIANRYKAKINYFESKKNNFLFFKKRYNAFLKLYKKLIYLYYPNPIYWFKENITKEEIIQLTSGEGGHSIYQELRKQGWTPNDFYNLLILVPGGSSPHKMNLDESYFKNYFKENLSPEFLEFFKKMEKIKEENPKAFDAIFDLNAFVIIDKEQNPDTGEETTSYSIKKYSHPFSPYLPLFYFYGLGSENWEKFCQNPEKIIQLQEQLENEIPYLKEAINSPIARLFSPSHIFKISDDFFNELIKALDIIKKLADEKKIKENEPEQTKKMSCDLCSLEKFIDQTDHSPLLKKLVSVFMLCPIHKQIVKDYPHNNELIYFFIDYVLKYHNIENINLELLKSENILQIINNFYVELIHIYHEIYRSSDPSKYEYIPSFSLQEYNLRFDELYSYETLINMLRLKLTDLKLTDLLEEIWRQNIKQFIDDFMRQPYNNRKIIYEVLLQLLHNSEIELSKETLTKENFIENFINAHNKFLINNNTEDRNYLHFFLFLEHEFNYDSSPTDCTIEIASQHTPYYQNIDMTNTAICDASLTFSLYLLGIIPKEDIDLDDDSNCIINKIMAKVNETRSQIKIEKTVSGIRKIDKKKEDNALKITIDYDSFLDIIKTILNPNININYNNDDYNHVRDDIKYWLITAYPIISEISKLYSSFNPSPYRLANPATFLSETNSRRGKQSHYDPSQNTLPKKPSA